LLRRLLDAAESAGRTGTVIEVLVLQALADHAGAALKRALTLAEPEGYARVFLDAGPAIVPMLTAIAKQDGAPPLAGQLLAAATPTAARRATVRPGLVEPLSGRELDVLRLLGTDLNGPDIARELVVSLNTVRTHTKNIYAKLGVTSRRAAVRRADELGLLA
jgi:LuxR family maltose regulon positive regulatory protein